MDMFIYRFLVCICIHTYTIETIDKTEASLTSDGCLKSPILILLHLNLAFDMVKHVVLL